MADVFFDIDAAFAEQEIARHDPIRFRLAGRDWEVPGVMPGLAVMRIARWEAEGRGLDMLTQSEQIALVGDVFPDDIWPALSAAGISIDDPRLEAAMMAVLGELMQRLEPTAKPDAAVAPGESTGPSSETSSPDGPSSKPTSRANTDSNFQVL
jgi:hypothetical protein